MSSTVCYKCQERPSSRVGGLCSTCWKALGKPDREAANALRAAATRPEGQEPSPALSTDTAGTLAAMRHVVSQPPTGDTTFQQKSMREWRDASPASFFSRLSDLEKAELGTRPPAEPTPSAEYDGEGRCPTCRRFPGQVDPDDQVTPDLGHDRVMELLGDESMDQAWGARLVAEARARGEERPADIRGWVTV
jgi:hypothetical protein